ncbi:hypothetical protein ES705_21681 [subsurface metagenome]
MIILRNRIFVLNEPFAPRLNPALAEEIGLNESIIYLQLEFWISISDKEYQGEIWTYQSLRNFQKVFRFLSRDTINRAIKSLEKQKLIKIGNFNKKKYDNTRWFAIDYKGVDRIKSVTVSQIQGGLSHSATGLSQNATTIPETTPDIEKELAPAKNESLRKELDSLDFSKPEIEGLLRTHTPEQIKDKLKALENRRDIRIPKMYLMKMLKADYPNKNTPVISGNGGNGDSSDDLYPRYIPKKDDRTPEELKRDRLKIAELAGIALEKIRGYPGRLQVASS